MSIRGLATKVGMCFCVATLLGSLMNPGTLVALETNDINCADAETLQLNTSLRGYGRLDGESDFYQVDVPAAGLVSLHIAVPSSAETEAKLGLFNRNCVEQDGLTDRSTVIQQTPTGLVVWTEAPGIYTFAVAAMDPQEALGEYQLTAGFATVARRHFDRSNDPFVLPQKLAGGGDSPGEIELEPDVNEDPLPLAGDGLQGGGDSPGEIELEPDANDDPLPLAGDDLLGGGDSPGEIELEPDANDPLPLQMILRLAARELCRELKQDDHGDTPICATRIKSGREVRGVIHNSWSDDHDLFALTVSETRTVYIETVGPTDTFGTLLDRHGQPLATDDDGGSHENFRIVRTLSPGRYFVRVEGSLGAEGPYSLRLETRTW